MEDSNFFASTSISIILRLEGFSWAQKTVGDIKIGRKRWHHPFRLPNESQCETKYDHQVSYFLTNYCRSQILSWDLQIQTAIIRVTKIPQIVSCKNIKIGNPLDIKNDSIFVSDFLIQCSSNIQQVSFGSIHLKFFP